MYRSNKIAIVVKASEAAEICLSEEHFGAASKFDMLVRGLAL